MERRNSVWNELSATVSCTTIKMNAHFVPRFFSFVCISEHLEHWLARFVCCPICLFHLEIFHVWLLGDGYKRYLAVEEVQSCAT